MKWILSVDVSVWVATVVDTFISCSVIMMVVNIPFILSHFPQIHVFMYLFAEYVFVNEVLQVKMGGRGGGAGRVGGG